MAARQNNRFRILCIGVAAFSAVSAIVFASLGGGEGMTSVEGGVVEGFNSDLPNANVESVSDDRVVSARIEDERRKREEMLGMTGSHFNLLEIEEEKSGEVEDIDSLSDMQERTRADLERQVGSITGGRAAVVYNAPETNNTREEQARKREERRNNVYKDAQEIFGKDVLPDKEGQAEPKEETVKEEVKPEAVKKKSGFNTMNRKDVTVGGNSIRAVVHGTHSNLTTNSPVKLRLLDPLKIGDVTIPRNSFVYGKVSFADARVMIAIDNVKYQNNVLPFKGEIYDNDGSRGIYVPDNAVNDAVKEAGEGAVSGTPGVTNRGRSVAGYAVDLVNRGGSAIKNAVVNRIGKNKVSISENYMVTIRTVEK